MAFTFNAEWSPVYTSMITSLAGAASSAYGKIQEGESESERLKFNARVALDNAKNAEYAAQSIHKLGIKEAKRYTKRVDQLISTQRARYAASGVDVTYGAPVEVVSETALAGASDAATIRRNADLEAWKLKAGAAGYRAEARGFGIGADDASRTGKIRAGTTLLTGAGTVALRFVDYRDSKSKKAKEVSRPSLPGKWG